MRADIVEPIRARLHAVAIARWVLVAAASGLAALVLLTHARAATWPRISSLLADDVVWSVSMAVAVLMLVLLRGYRLPPTLVQTALWIEEQGGAPPDYALVTWVEQGRPGDGALAAAAHARFASATVTPSLRQHAVRDCAPPLAFLLVALLVWWRGEVMLVRDSLAPRAGGLATNADHGAPASGLTLSPWRVDVVPPAYTMRGRMRLGDVSTVRALAGSQLIVTGDRSGRTGSRSGLAPSATLRLIGGGSTRDVVLPVRRENTSWRIRMMVRDTPFVVRVAHESTQRQLVVEVVGDTVPRVTLQRPIRDSVFRRPEGRIDLAADVADDLGLADAFFEVVITSGEGERFTVRTVTLGRQRWGRAARMLRATLRSTLDLAAVGLQPGDVLHVRALARDHHPDRDHDRGTSETRAFRIARVAEYDSVAVEPAPPAAVDSSLLSQRMLLLLTQKLDRRQRTMLRADVVRESQRLARDQARLRLAVGDVAFQRLSGESSAEHAHSAGDGHDHGVDLQGGKLTLKSAGSGVLDEGNDAPVIAINQPLLEAYNAMWDAGRALEQGDPHAAIPPMQRALEAIERSRAASRLYLRGRPPQVIVDIAKVRLTGRDTGVTSPREVRRALPALAAARDRRLVALLAANPPTEALRDSLAVLRIESLSDAPAFASALGSALDALVAGRDLTPSLVRARRVLGVVDAISPTLWTRGVPRR